MKTVWPRSPEFAAAEFDCHFLRCCGIEWPEMWEIYRARERMELMRAAEAEMIQYQLAPPMLYDDWGRRIDEIYRPTTRKPDRG